MLAKNIRYLRKQKNWSQDYISEKMDYKSYTTIQKWEMGIAEPPIKKLKELANLFGVDMDDLANKDFENQMLIEVVNPNTQEQNDGILKYLNTKNKDYIEKYHKLNEKNQENINNQIDYLLFKQDEKRQPITIAAHSESKILSASSLEAIESYKKIVESRKDTSKI